MSLMQLLAVCRTVAPVRDAPSRYKMVQENLLPKFGPVKEDDGVPVALEQMPEPVAAQPLQQAELTQIHDSQKRQPGAPAPHRSLPPLDGGREAGVAPPQEPRPLASVPIRPAKARVSLETKAPEYKATNQFPVTGKGMTRTVFEQSQNTAERVSGSGSGRVRKVASPWMGWSLLSNPFTRANKSSHRTGPIQCELALAQVTPVRNDLNESDLEIVASSQDAVLTDTTEQVAQTGRKLKPAGTLWSRLKEGLFRITAKET